MDAYDEFFENLSKGSCPSWTQIPEVVETHISKVFLLEEVVYKFKKPLCLSFLDYSTPQKRLDACWREFDLGRRFGGDIYLRVVFFQINKQNNIKIITVTRTDPVCVGGEYGVEMRRLPMDLMMDRRLIKNNINDDDIEKIVSRFVSCSAQGHKSSLSPDEYIKRVYEHIQENRTSGEQLLEIYQEECERWKRLSGILLMGWAKRQSVLRNRVASGKIIEGHGDLRPEHVFLGRSVAFIDPIEFSEDFRTMDLVDELCFLSMECSFAGFFDISQKILRGGMSALDDHAPEGLLRFYQAYRAMVRAKVHYMRAYQLGDKGGSLHEAEFRKAQRYVRLGENFMSEGVALESDRPLVLLVAGTMGSGKSTLARFIAHQLGCDLLQTDVLRGKVFNQNKNEILSYGEGKYSTASRLRVYELMVTRMLGALERGYSVVLDGSFGDPSALSLVTSTLEKEKISYAIIHCDVPIAIAQERITKRSLVGPSESEARPDLVQDQRFKGKWDFSSFPSLTIDGTLPVEEEFEKVLDFLDDEKGWKRNRL